MIVERFAMKGTPFIGVTFSDSKGGRVGDYREIDTPYSPSLKIYSRTVATKTIYCVCWLNADFMMC